MFLFIGILFSLIGVILAFVPATRKKNFFILPLVLGLGVIYLHAWGPLANKEKKLAAILNINSNNIVELHIYPGDNTNAKRHLIKSTMRIHEPAFLNEFASALNKGKSSNDFHQNSLWTCKVELVKKDKKVAWLDVSRQGSTTLVRPLSGEYGWDYGTIRADEVGSLFERITKQ
jgi:hypothetical protein